MSTSQAFAADFPTTDGVWFQGLRVGTDSLSVQADMAGEFGILSMDRKTGGLGVNPAAFPEVPIGDCRYVFRHQEGAVSQAQMISGGGECPQEVSLNFAPWNGGLRFEFDGQPVTYPDGTAKQEVTLQSNLGPVRGDLAVIPDNLEIFGVGPGMTLAEVEAVLTPAGFRVLERSESRDAGGDYGTDSWKSTARVYVRGELTGNGIWPDKLQVIYGSVAPETSLDDAEALFLRRMSRLAEPVAPTVMTSALNDKYGVSFQNEPDGRGVRAWDRAGQPILQPEGTNSHYLHCGDKGPDEMRQGITLQAPVRSPSASEDCGSRANITSARDGNGLVHYLDMSIWTDDLILQEYWARYAAGIAEQAKPLLSSATTAAPDL